MRGFAATLSGARSVQQAASRRGRRTLAAVLLPTCLILAALARPAAAAPRVFPILVMGDSYSAGNGAGAYYGAKGCWRSPNNYGGVFARTLQAPPDDQPTVVENVACSGDTTIAFSHSTHGRRPQLDAVNKGYGVIFLTLGGDDVDFAGIVQNCLVQISRDGQRCDQLLSHAERLLEDGTLQGRLTGVLSGIFMRANVHADIVLVGYPSIDGDTNYQLPYGHGRTVAVSARLEKIGALGDRVEQQAVNRLDASRHTGNIIFVTTKTLFAGHELFAQSLNPNRWFVAPMTDATIASIDTWYHPNQTGWAQEAALLLNDPRVPKSNSIPTPPPTPLGGAGDVTTSGRVGPLQLHRSTRADVVAFAGPPESEQESTTYEVNELGYGCTFESGYANCQTTFYLDLHHGTLIEFWTKSSHYTALGAIHIGSSTRVAERVSRQPATAGCLEAIYVVNTRAKISLVVMLKGGRAVFGKASAPSQVFGGHVESIALNGGAGALDCV